VEAASQNVPWEAVAVFGGFLIFLIQGWVKDLLFYKRNGWDFTHDSGRKMYHGDDGVMTPERLMSNRARVHFGYPFMIVGLAVILVAAVLLRK
jgi:hypothetical protein